MTKLVEINILRGVGIDGVMYEPGKTVRVTPAVAKQLLQMGKAAEAKKEDKQAAIDHASKKEAHEPAKSEQHIRNVAAAKKKGSGKDENGKTLSDEDKVELIKIAIDELDPDVKENFNSKGEPDCKGLTKTVGFQVTNRLRNDAMEELLEAAEG